MIRKTIMVLLFMAMLPLAFTGCELSDGGSGDSGSDSSVITQKALKVMDASGKELGVCVYANPYEISIISKNGYYYSISWNSNFDRVINICYSGANLTGIPYYEKNKGYEALEGIIYSKVLFYNPAHSQLYTFLNFDSNNIAVHEDTVVTTNSCLDFEGNVHNHSANNDDMYYYELRPISREEAGIPDTITPPIRLVDSN